MQSFELFIWPGLRSCLLLIAWPSKQIFQLQWAQRFLRLLSLTAFSPSLYDFYGFSFACVCSLQRISCICLINPVIRSISVEHFTRDSLPKVIYVCRWIRKSWLLPRVTSNTRANCYSACSNVVILSIRPSILSSDFSMKHASFY